MLFGDPRSRETKTQSLIRVPFHRGPNFEAITEMELHECAEVSLQTMMKDVIAPKGDITNANRSFQRAGMLLLRDLLSGGKECLKDTRELKRHVVPLIEEGIFQELGTLDFWHDSPTPKQIADWCHTLDEVNSAVLWSTDAYVRECKGMSVQEIAYTPVEALAERIMSKVTGQLDVPRAERLQVAAQAFAAEFPVVGQPLQQSAPNPSVVTPARILYT